MIQPIRQRSGIAVLKDGRIETEANEDYNGKSGSAKNAFRGLDAIYKRFSALQQCERI